MSALTPLTALKVALAAVGVLTWGYGYRVDDAGVRWVGIAFLAAAAVLRFVRRREPAEEE